MYLINLTAEEYKQLSEIFMSNLGADDKNINLAKKLGFQEFVALYENF